MDNEKAIDNFQKTDTTYAYPCKDHLGNTYSCLKDMLDFYKISKATYKSRKRAGWTLEKCLTSPVLPTHIQVTDHEGNLFNSIEDMCNFWNVKPTTYYTRRTRYNMSLKDALTCHLKPRITWHDHLGNEYNTLYEMCTFYGISPKTYRDRKNKGLSLEEILTSPKLTPTEKAKISASVRHSAYVVKDHLGNTYNSVKNMCKHYNISYKTYYKRRESGWSLEKTLTTPRTIRPIIDFNGNTYDTWDEMCNHYGFKAYIVRDRLRQGWSLQDALTVPQKKTSNGRGNKSIDHLGNTYDTLKEMCMAWHIGSERYLVRRKSGWTLEEALTIPRNLYIGEYRVAECLKRLNAKFYHDCTIKTIFTDLGILVDWDDFLSELQSKLGLTGHNWSKLKIQRLRPDFVIYTDKENKIRGIIEFDGEQHQNFVEFFFKTIEEFYRRSNTDFVKQSFWEYMNIPMLRIRHDQIDRIDDMVKDFIDNPQNYIHNHNTYLSEEEYWSMLTKQKQQIELAFNSADTYDNQIELEDEQEELAY